MKRKMIIPTGKGEKLGCGCEIGYFHCPEADRLWSEVNLIYGRTGYSLQYIKARDAYRRYVGIEIKEEYCEVAVKRLRQMVMELKV